MNTDLASDLLHEALLTALQLGAPPLLAVLVVSLVVSLLQALMQLHDPTINIVPRLFVAAIAVLALLPWMLDRMVAFATDLYAQPPLGM
jgi:flagellar biosynthetic protein FliQ